MDSVFDGNDFLVAIVCLYSVADLIAMINSPQFKAMKDIGRHAADCLDMIQNNIQPDISTDLIDVMVRCYALKHDLVCAPKDYKGFPAHCCTSVNHVVAHGIPSKTKILKEGDIVKVDITFKDKNGWHGDSCRTYAVGKISRKAELLIKHTKTAMMLGIEQCMPGNTIGMIGDAIQDYVDANGVTSVMEYVGHGIGQEFHTLPRIWHGRPKKFVSMFADRQIELKPGMMFTVEPMLNVGKEQTKVLSDGWTVVTKDKSLSAQFEHTIGITDDGHTIFTSNGD